MHATVTSSPDEFAARAGAFLAARPIDHNLLATVLHNARAGESLHSEPLFAWAESAGEVVGAASWTRPLPLLASTMPPEAAAALMAELLDAGAEPPGVTGPEPAASQLAEAWRQRAGGTVRRGTTLPVYWLDRVTDPPRAPAGTARLATAADRDLLIEWTAAFFAESGAEGGEPGAVVDQRLRRDQLLVWDAGGRAGPVSMAATSPPAAGVVRVGLVYTPPAQRGRGYGTALVAAVSRRALDAGATHCMLYADGANPVSNRIYQAIGYRRGADSQVYRFSPPAPRS